QRVCGRGDEQGPLAEERLEEVLAALAKWPAAGGVQVLLQRRADRAQLRAQEDGLVEGDGQSSAPAGERPRASTSPLPGATARLLRLTLPPRAASFRALPEERMRVAVLGGAGFIGSHLVDRLLERGDEVVAVDSLLTGWRDNLAHLAE